MQENCPKASKTVQINKCSKTVQRKAKLSKQTECYKAIQKNKCSKTVQRQAKLPNKQMQQNCPKASKVVQTNNFVKKANNSLKSKPNKQLSQQKLKQAAVQKYGNINS